MARSQVQSREASAGDTRRTGNVPAERAQGGWLMPRDPLVAWAASPFSLMRRLSDDMDQLFGQLSRGVLPLAAQRSDAAQVEWLPALEISERDGKLVVQADLPGLGADDVTVEVTDGVLTLSGERLEERETGGDGVRRTERRYGRFSRSLALPEGAQTEDIQASFRNGVLEITIPLSQPTTQRRTVDVQGASRKETRSSNGETGVSAGQSASQRGDAPEVSSASRAAPAT